MVVQDLETPTEHKPDNPTKDKIVASKCAKPIDPDMDLGLDRDLQKKAEFQQEDSRSFGELDSSEFNRSICLTRMLADHELAMAEQRTAKARMNPTMGPSGMTGADAAEKDGNQDLLRPALSDFAEAPCVSEESDTDDREARAVSAVLVLGNLDCDKPAGSAATASPVSVERRSCPRQLS